MFKLASYVILAIVDLYIKYLNNESKENIDKLKFIPEGYHIHHKDENFNNNSLDNLELIDPTNHGYIHATKNHNNLRFVVTKSKIVSIEDVCESMTYDIKCMYPYNNYIAKW